VRRVLPVVLVPLALLLPAAPATAAPISLGVSAGDVNARCALLWAHATRAGRVRLELARNRRLTSGLRRFRARADGSHDFTVHRRVRGLRPDTRYFFRFRQGRQRSQRGSFRTAPARASNLTIEFAWSGDADAQPAPGQTAPFWNRFEIYRAMAAERNHFNVNLGDVIYSDTEVLDDEGRPAAPTALTVATKWAKYRQNLAQRNLQRLRGSAGLYNVWDDHEFVNDFTSPENGAVYDAGVQAFTDYNPVRYSRSQGLYRSYRWGRNLELFVLDERSFRSAKASADGVCNNPSTGQPDLAPTAPQNVRDQFSILVPSLAQPVSQQCLDTINDPSRSLLGPAQLERFYQAISRSTARFKVVLNQVPIQQYYVFPYDRWEGYEAERKKLVEALQANVKNVIFLSTDVHASLVNTIKFDTLGPGAPRDSGIFDVTTGPVATATYSTEIDREVGPGYGTQVDELFFEGFMRCSEIDTYSYGQVTVTSRELTVRLRDAAGNPVVNKSTGQPCAPIVVEAEEGVVGT
jgi:phosphodiesterase/alkaline phosphatase D-like protein